MCLVTNLGIKIPLRHNVQFIALWHQMIIEKDNVLYTIITSKMGKKTGDIISCYDWKHAQCL